MKHPTEKTHRTALTLLEVLAVITALTLTGAMLAPTLANIRSQDKLTTCLQNLARIGQASIIYASQDPNQNPIPVHPHALEHINVARTSCGPEFCGAAKAGEAGISPILPIGVPAWAEVLALGR